MMVTAATHTSEHTVDKADERQNHTDRSRDTEQIGIGGENHATVVAIADIISIAQCVVCADTIVLVIIEVVEVCIFVAR